MISDRLSVDELDARLAARLVADGRETNLSLATALGVNQATVAARLRRLAAAGVMRVVAVMDVEAFGYAFLAFAMIDVAKRAATDVAEDLAEIPELISVNVVTGRCDIFVRLIARDHDELARIVGEQIPAVDGVRTVQCDVIVDIPRASQRYGLLHGVGPPPVSLPSTLDEMDGRIIDLLRVDARTSNRKIASKLGVSEGTVRNRVRRLQDEKFIRIQAVCDYETFGHPVGVLAGIHVSRGQVARVGRELVGLEEIQNVMRTVGTFDFFVILFLRSQAEYHSVLHERLPRIKGVDSVSVFLIDSATKHHYSWTKIM